MKLKWREIRMQAGHPKEGTSPAIQQEAGINRDQTWSPKKGEGEKLRDD